MPYAFVSTDKNPMKARKCLVNCDLNAGPLLMAYFRAKPKKDNPKGFMIPRYKIRKHPYDVMCLLEKKGFRVVTSAASHDAFVWTMHKEDLSVKWAQ